MALPTRNILTASFYVTSNFKPIFLKTSINWMTQTLCENKLPLHKLPHMLYKDTHQRSCLSCLQIKTSNLVNSYVHLGRRLYLTTHTYPLRPSHTWTRMYFSQSALWSTSISPVHRDKPLTSNKPHSRLFVTYLNLLPTLNPS